MWKAVHNESIPKSKLDEYLDNWGLNWGMDSFDAWVIWRRSNYVTLPFDGGWFAQPKSLRDDFLTLDLLRSWHEIQAEKPSVDHLTDPLEAFD